MPAFRLRLLLKPFALAFRGLQGEQLVHDAFTAVPGGIEGTILFMLMLIFVLVFFMEWIEISYIIVPLFPLLLMAGNVDLIRAAILIAVMLQTSFLTLPFGWALFYVRGVTPPEIPRVAIYLGVLPFIALQLLTVVLMFLNPELATWLPKAIGW